MLKIKPKRPYSIAKACKAITKTSLKHRVQSQSAKQNEYLYDSACKSTLATRTVMNFIRDNKNHHKDRSKLLQHQK